MATRGRIRSLPEFDQVKEAGRCAHQVAGAPDDVHEQRIQTPHGQQLQHCFLEGSQIHHVAAQLGLGPLPFGDV